MRQVLGRLSPTGALAMLAALIVSASPGTARGDYLSLLMELGGRGERKVLILRQVPDNSHGFDQFFLEEVAVPANTRSSQVELGGKERSLLVSAGQYELYRKRVDSALEQEMERFRGRGYKPVCRGASEALQSVVEARLSFGEIELVITIEPGRFSEVLVARAGSSYRLLRFPAVPAGVTVGHRGLRDVVLLDGGRMLGIVVRTQLTPAPANGAEDAPYFFPLKKAAARLGFEIPLPNLCGDDSAGETQDQGNGDKKDGDKKDGDKKDGDKKDGDKKDDGKKDDGKKDDGKKVEEDK